ncbi:DedA family protein [Enterobacteriaceae endosymbiont of Donacia tomentosa]|uniref:DedA family protein n=1 Tax=Enterobacteriaceae endosymbiont of Donacia tomentosa TaxID=2675787 RepID=UPI0014490AF6|nr:DedA family protein [Enterobacteriaceae endosymbiont of Donacia tomentosa]QJC31788.1 DedA family protein [Enterobacteriaceae endosymbiont of Donacia tomentosa]
MLLDINIIKIVIRYGYLIVFLGALIEGETFVIISGMLAHKRILIFYKIIVVAVIGAILGDQFLFYIGKKYSKNFLHLFKNYNLKIKKYSNLIINYPYFFIIIIRFMYGFRLIGPVVIGITNISNLKFFVFNIIGAIIWVLIFSSSGYFFGEVITSFAGDINKIIKYILCLLSLIFIIKIFYKIFKKHH